MSNKKECLKCEDPKALTNFYMSSSELHTDKKYPICKSCLKETISIDDEESVKDMLMNMNKPFIHDLWSSSVDEGTRTNKDPIGLYLKNVFLNHKKLTWKDSIFNNIKEIELNNTIKETPQDSNFITDEILDKWGFGYTNDEYRQFERKYNKLINNYGEKTALHTEGLITYIRYRVKEEIATAKGEVKEAKEWGQLASKAAQDAKINVSQLSKSDISGGVDVLSQMFEAVENEISVIPLLPKIMEQPYDDADLIIWATINYNRRLEDKPPTTYRDIWNFYDDMLQEHFETQNFSEEQIKEFKARRNNVFRDLEKVYIEPLYNNDGE
ncbi:hypothetical protein [Metabacillus fastidiosus]|uniref:hypothetical protein n=1 Tax=Metabacillus fastidiosus TaxID=1458 RepID=UPI003D2A15C3